MFRLLYFMSFIRKRHNSRKRFIAIMATAFLITSLGGVVRRVNDIVNEHVLKTLYIQVYLKQPQPTTGITQWVSRKITDLYTFTSQLYPNLDVRIILSGIKRPEQEGIRKVDQDIDIIIMPKSYESVKETSLVKYKKRLSVVLLDDSDSEEEDESHLQMYNNVVLGGTFDRFHTGHKILITNALLHCSKSITVGVTDGDMIKGKILWELIEPCERRIEVVESFIKEVDITVSYNVVPILDMYGPTKSDRNLNMIVVSDDTKTGAVKVNEKRIENGLKALDVFCIRLVEDTNQEEKDEEVRKISSSNIRKRLLGTRIRQPEEKRELPRRPYLIGLTGGICSGKSSISNYLRALGAEVIDCDKIAHELYKSGNPAFYEVVKEFGNEILDEDGEIDRRKLGGIVFNDKKRMDTLNKLLWPRIIEETVAKCRQLYSENKKDIIVLEAAVLLQAGWQESVHEIWAAIIPPEEAISRLMKRNKLTEEEAASRIRSQPTNLEQIEIANIVFCSLWSFEYTQKQVMKAWKIVTNSLNRYMD